MTVGEVKKGQGHFSQRGIDFHFCPSPYLWSKENWRPREKA